MNTLNRAASSLFDLLLAPFELMGSELALILVSGLFGIGCLLIFKQISWQKGIKGTKDKIKGNMIAIRLYQDDLGIVSKSVGSVLLRNIQYLSLNFGPILPLFVPMMIVAAQFVVRYAFDPLPVVQSDEEVADLLPGEGVLIEIELKPGSAAQVQDLRVELPDGLQPIHPRPAEDGSPVLMRSSSEGAAYLEVVARKPLDADIGFFVGDRRIGSKHVVAGEQRARLMQGERVSDFWSAWLWPAEDTFGDDTPLARVGFVYPDRDLTLLPDGALGVIIVFFLASIVFGAVILKPLNIQI